MPILGKTLWFGTRIGIIGGACYYTTQIGLWGDSAQTEQLYKDLYKVTAPYVKQTPIEVPELPRISDATRVLTQTWNRQVITTTEFLLHLPSHVYGWASSAYNKINELVSDPAPPTA